jgi:hypothetical protein
MLPIRFSPAALFVVIAFTTAACGSSGRGEDAPGATAGQAIESTDPAAAPPGFAQVKDGLYRGAHPDRGALAYLQKLGVTTILSLQQPAGSIIEGDKANEVEDEQAGAAELGLAYVSVPMTSWASADAYDDAWSQIRPMLDSPSGLYVHCEHGKDRTGLVIALERVFVEQWAPERAHDEMLALGHSSLLVKLDSYFWSKTEGTAR